MSWFYPPIVSTATINIFYLNTSYVLVLQYIFTLRMFIDLYLNTSYVLVLQIIVMKLLLAEVNLNTSYVLVLQEENTLWI